MRYSPIDNPSTGTAGGWLGRVCAERCEYDMVPSNSVEKRRRDGRDATFGRKHDRGEAAEGSPWRRIILHSILRGNASLRSKMLWKKRGPSRRLGIATCLRVKCCGERAGPP